MAKTRNAQKTAPEIDASCRYLKLEIFSEIRSSIAYEYEREDQEEIECAIEREAKPA